MTPDDPQNPYAAPVVENPQAAETGAEAVRREHIAHETSVKGIGFLFLLGGALTGLGGSALFHNFQTRSSGGMREIVIMLMLLVLTVLQCWVGFGIRRLWPWARMPGVVFSVAGLLAFPVGTIFALYFLYLLLSNKGRMVFSPEYAEVIRETPHVKYRTSIWVWVVLIAFLLFLALAFLTPLFV
jgi:hypothetical protein